MAQGRMSWMDATRCCDRRPPCAGWFSKYFPGQGKSEMDQNTVDRERAQHAITNALSKRLEAAGWGLFFIWVGVSLLLDFGWGVGLIGVAAIILLGQSARISHGLTIEMFWAAVGVLFLLGGIWNLFQVKVELVPLLLIGAGGALILSLIRRR